MKNREIIEHINALGNFTKDKLPTKLSFAVVKNFNKLKSVYKDYDEARVLLVEKYAEKDNKGEIVRNDNGTEVFKEGCLSDWNKEVNELLDINVEFDIHLVDFAVIENLQMSVMDIEAIEFMIN